MHVRLIYSSWGVLFSASFSVRFLFYKCALQATISINCLVFLSYFCIEKKNPACIEKNVLLLNVSLAGGVNISQFDKKFQDFLPYFEEYSQLKVLLSENSNLHFLNIPLLFLLLFLELICSLAFSMWAFFRSSLLLLEFCYLLGQCFASHKIVQCLFPACCFYLFKSINFSNEFMHSTYCSAYRQVFSQCAEKPFVKVLISFLSSQKVENICHTWNVIELSMLVTNLYSVYKTFTGGTCLSVKDILIFNADHSKQKL